MLKEKLIKEYIINGKLDLQAIVNDYAGYILTIIRNISKDVLKDEDEEEIVSDILFAIWKNREKLNVDLSLKPYIAGISKNVVKNKLRTINIKEYSSLEDQEISNNFKIEEDIETKEKIEIISKELDKIGDDKQIFIMFYYQNKKSKQIAEELNLTETNVNTKLYRIKNKIRKSLERRGYFYGE